MLDTSDERARLTYLETRLSELEGRDKEREDLEKLRLRVNELELRVASRRSSAPLVVTLLALVVVLAAGFGLSYLQASRAYRADLTLRAITARTPEEAATNLVFLVRTGLLDDPSGEIIPLVSETEFIPYLPPRPGTDDADAP